MNRFSQWSCVLLFLCLFGGSPLWAARPWLVLFGSEGCEECAAIKELWAERPFTATSAVLVYVSIDNDDNYAFLKKVERALQVKRPGNSFPVMLVGRKMVAGESGFYSIAMELEELLANPPQEELFEGIQKSADAAKSGIVSWNVPKEASAGGAGGPSATPALALIPVPGGQPPRLLYLSTPGCRKCARQQRELDGLQRQLPALKIDHYEVTTTEGQVQMMRVRRHFRLTEESKNLAPIVIWQDGYVTGRLAEAEELSAVLQRPSAGEPFWAGEITEEERAALQRKQRDFLSNTTWLMALGGGALDGINPCAFATIIFLISYLFYLKRGRKFILAVGLCFGLGVFVSYFLFGVGLSFLVDYLSRFAVIRIVIYVLFAFLGYLFFLLHLRDAIRFRKSGKAQDMDMGLGVETHRKIHDRIHGWGRLTTWLAIPAAILLGVVVSSMEFVCTGQVYLPFIMAINSTGFHFQACLRLLLYNIAFIVPLLVVTFLAYYGVGAKSLSAWARRHVFDTKLAMACLFLLLGVVMTVLALR